MSVISINRMPIYFLMALAIVLPFHFFLAPVIGLLTLSVFLLTPFHRILKNLKKNSLFALFSLCYLLYALAMLNTENQESGLKELGQKVSFFIFPLILAGMEKIKKVDFKRIIRAFIGSLFLACLSSFIIGFAENSFEKVPTYIELSTFLHPTYFSAYLSLAIIFLFTQFGFSGRKTKKNVLLFLLISFFVAFNFLINSKLGVIINILLIFLFLLKSYRGSSKKTVIGIILFFAAAVAFIFTQFSTVKARFLSIGQAFKVENISKDTDESTGLRVLIWKEALQLIKEHPLAGVGTGDTKEVLTSQYEKSGIRYAYENRLNAHNQYLEWMVTFGIPGTLFWMMGIFYALWVSFQKRNFLFLWFHLIVLGMLMGESFLEREVGIVFFAFFNSLLFFHAPPQSSDSY